MDDGPLDLSSLTDADWGDLLNANNVGNFDWASILADAGLSDADLADLLNAHGVGDLNLDTSAPGDDDTAGSGGGNTPSGGGSPGGTPSTPGAGDGDGTSSGTSPGSGGFDINSLIKSLGGWGSVLGLLGAGVGGYLNNKATTKATKQVTDAINSANTQVTDILGGGSPAAAGYAAAGQTALGKLGNMNYVPLAPRFGQPIGGKITLPPPSSSLASILKKA